jgi:cytochrome c5
MPPSGPLTGTQIALIYSWIQTGAENTIGCGPVLNTCDTVNVKYSTTIKPILDVSCLGCHGTGTNPDMSNYGVLSSYLATNSQTLLNDINFVTGANPMPPNGAPKLSDCNLKQFHIWIQAGFPNN